MNNKYRTHNFMRQANIDNLAYQMLQPIIKDFNFLPYTGSAIRPSAMVTIMNDIIINQRKSVIEFGCGLSTMILLKFAQVNKLDFTLYTVEEDEKWILFIEQQLKVYGLLDQAKLIYAPITKMKEKDKYWHKLDFVESLPELDCVIVDGPKAFSTKNKTIRDYALYALENKLSNRYSVFLDDCHREAERETIKQWAERLKLKHQLHYQHLGVIFSGEFFNIFL